MSTEYESELGLLIAVCDGCGERRTIDADDPHASEGVAAAMAEVGWERRPLERQRFGGAFGSGGIVATFEQDFCPDCQSGDRPRPLFGAHRRRQAVVDDDPCDEWPRALVFAAVGLPADCGHPAGSHPCPYCSEGYPIGAVRPWWRR